MTTKVDLTENRDFRDRNPHVLTGGMLRSSKTQKFVTTDEYDEIQLFERVFGEEEHNDERRHAFKPKNEPTPLPWNYRSWIRGLSLNRYAKKIPWAPHEHVGESTGRIKLNLFGLR